MNIRDAEVIAKNNIRGAENLFSIVVDDPYKDPELVGQFLISQACNDVNPSYNDCDFIWYNIAGNETAKGITDNTIDFFMSYYDSETDLAEAEQRADEIAAQLDLVNVAADNKADAIKLIYEYIAEHCTYDTTTKAITYYSPTGTGTVYKGRNGLKDVLISGRSVCQGLSRAIYYFLNKYICPCRIIQGHEFNKGLYYHCWNIAQLDNGLWYYIDVTAAVHEHDAGRSDYSKWLLRSPANFNNTGRPKYVPLANYQKSSWINRYKMTESSYIF